MLGVAVSAALRGFDPSERLAHHSDPLRFFRCFGKERAPYPGRVLAAAILLRRQALVIAGGHVAGIEPDRGVECCLRFRADDAILRGDQSLAKIGFALRRGSEQA